MEYIAFDCHKRYTWAVVEDQRGLVKREGKIPHARGALREFLRGCVPGSPVAVETVGNWYWIVDEIEKAGFRPKLVHAGKAKLMLGMVNKTDKLDARGLNRLQRAGTLPVVWIPPGELRDKRELTRTRMVLVSQRTQLKNRIHATLAKYGLEGGGKRSVWGEGEGAPGGAATAASPSHPLRHRDIAEPNRRLGESDQAFGGEDEGSTVADPGGEAP